MTFVLIIFHGTAPLPGSEAWNALPRPEQARIYADYQALDKTPGVEPGLPLGHAGAARVVRVHDGKPEVTTGTYLPEAAGGYLVLEADTLAAAVDLAAKIPAARLGGAIEIRPAEKYW
jgi:hypothetical protein